MGNSGSTVGDLFFPDNPNRRRRAEELRNQINAYGAEFKELDAAREEKLNRIRDKVNALMASKGFDTIQQLEEHVRSILDSSQLANYDNLKKTLDLNDKAQGIIWDVVSIVGASSGVIIGGAFMAGVVTGGAALAALGVIGEILAAVGVIVVIFGVIEGAIERSKLRDAINELWPQRAKVKQIVEQMHVVINWIDTLDVWLNNPATEDPATLDALLNGGFEPEYKSWTMDHVYDVLRDMDEHNGSWTNEDPGRGALHASSTNAATDSMPKQSTLESNVQPFDDLVVSEKSDPTWTGKFAYKGILSKESCLIEQDGQMYKITAREWDENNIQLATTSFDIEPVEVKQSNKTEDVRGKLGNASSLMITASSKFAPRPFCSISVLEYSTR